MTWIEFLPWQTEQARQWLACQDRRAHAWIFHGLPGIGKLRFAWAAAAAILCENNSNGMACGRCVSCRWMLDHTHPDFQILVPQALEESLGLNPDPEAEGRKSSTAPSQVIRVSQLRNLIDKQFFSTTSARGGTKVVIIYPAETLNDESANTLLKILEEPPAQTLFLLVSHSIRKLLPTILSRCQRLKLDVPEASQAQRWLQEQSAATPEKWLAMSGGAPLRALELSRSEVEPVAYWLSTFVQELAQGRMPLLHEYVTRLEKLPPASWLLTLQCMVLDIQLLHVGGRCRYFPELEQDMLQIAHAARGAQITELLRKLNSEQPLATHPFNQKLYIQATLQYVIVILLVRPKKQTKPCS